MTETTEDTETFSVTLATPEPAVTCTGKTPHYSSGCSLLKHYDADNNGKIPMAEWNAAVSDQKAGKITQAELDFVTAAWKAGTINAKCSGCYTPPAAPAQGQLEELTYPASVNHGADVRVGFKIHNTGGSTGTFIARLYKGVLHAGTDWRAVVHAGDSPSGAITVKAPTTGDHVYYTLALFLET